MVSVLGAGEGSALFMLASSLCMAEASAEGLPAAPTEHKDTYHKQCTGAAVLHYTLKACDIQQVQLIYNFSGKTQHCAKEQEMIKF